jgi:hypothetical protein
MFFHLIETFVSKPLFGVEAQDRVNKIFQFFACVWIFPVAMLFGLLHNPLYSKFFLNFNRGKGRKIVRHLVCVHPNRPDINHFSVTLLQYHFRGVIDRSACLSTAQLVLPDFLSHSKVCEFYVTVLKD